jgi:tetratricopeptide (TPR) repeat protein
LAVLCGKQGRHDEAERLFQRALAIRTSVGKSQHPEIAETLHELAVCWEGQNRLQEAFELYQRAYTMREYMQGAEHPHTSETRRRLTVLRHRLHLPDDQTGADENM